jgi:basic membrane lipoprotein Med (substrate-binding protein (PBP1-ABC) superfamily)
MPLALLALLASLALLLSSCASKQPETSTYRVALMGLEGDQLAGQRDSLLQYGQRRIEAELGAEVEYLPSGQDRERQGLFATEGGYDLVVSVGRLSSQQMLQTVPAGAQAKAVALDCPDPSPPPGAGGADVTLVRYRVEEGAYVCGYLAGWLTGRNDHPLTNAAPIVGFIAAVDDPLQQYYDRGYGKGARAAAPNVENQRYFLLNSADSKNARAYAEQAVKKGADIIFCTPGPFNAEVLKVAQEKKVLVILVGADRSGESPQHVLTSLIIRDDNALFNAVNLAMRGELKAGAQEWGIREGVWSLAPFHDHDPHIRKELKEALRQEEEKAADLDYSS